MNNIKLKTNNKILINIINFYLYLNMYNLIIQCLNMLLKKKTKLKWQHVYIING